MSTTHLPATDTVGDSVQLLRATFGSGRTATREWRLEQLRGIIRLLDEREQELTEALAADLGKPAMTSFMGELIPPRTQAKYAIAHLEGWMKPEPAAVPTAYQPAKAWTVAEPKGVALIMAPWNWPVLLCLDPLVSAVAAGNTAIVKPSEITPTVSSALARWVPEYLDPEGVIVVEGGVDVSSALLDQRFDHILYTGSDRVGRIVMEAAAKHLTPVTLELGGKSPAIVTRNADLDVAARRLAWAKVTNAGQTCVAPDYVLVEEAVRAPFMERLLREFEASNRLADTTRIVNAQHRERLQRLLVDHGGTAIAARGAHSGVSGAMAPVVIADPDPESAVMQEEIFGPILPVVAVPTVLDAVAFVNERPKPLALYLFSDAQSDEDLVLSRTSSGSVCVNHFFYQIMLPELPFGGVGLSGMGAYHGKAGFETFSHRKAVLRKPASFDPSIAYPPFGPIARGLFRKLLR